MDTVVHSDPEVMSGAEVFTGTRVPVQHLWDYLEAGYGMDGFLEGFPSVSRRQAEWVLEQARTLERTTPDEWRYEDESPECPYPVFGSHSDDWYSGEPCIWCGGLRPENAEPDIADE